MTKFVHVKKPHRVITVMPLGDRVYLNRYYDEYDDDASLFGLSLGGISECGDKVTVRGSYISLVRRVDVVPEEVAKQSERWEYRWARDNLKAGAL